MKFWIMGLAVLSLQVGHFGIADDFKWEQDKRIPFRNHIGECGAYLSPVESESDQVNVGVGVDLRVKQFDQFKIQLAKLIEERGRDAVRGSVISVTGVKMGEESERKAAYRQVLRAEGIEDHEVDVRIFSLPDRERERIAKSSLAIAKRAWEEIQYFPPSKARDYQPPLWEEVQNGLVGTYLIEAVMISYFATEVGGVDFYSSMLTHLTIMTSYMIWTRSMTNWLLRDKVNAIIFLKQMALSLPFVINFNVLGNVTAIQEHVDLNGALSLITDLPGATVNLVKEQWLTLVLQTVFYSSVITSGVRRWVNEQVGVRRNNVARSVAPILEFPLLAPDAIAIAMASRTGEPLFDLLGIATVNTGHAALGGLILAGNVISHNRSFFLDWSIPVYEWVSDTRLARSFRWATSKMTNALSRKNKEEKVK